jgi:ubiquinone/menaquinone biosynthesis C-methylase UbiE
MRIRLRPKYSDEDLMKIYDHVYDHVKWDEHRTRIAWTIRRLQHFIDLRPEITRVVDLSCGDGAILTGLSVTNKVFGDLVQADHLTIPASAAEISVRENHGDLLICSETLEHLDDPDEFLRNAQENFKFIAISTPLGEDFPEKNGEHYWGWDLIGVNDMLRATQWYPLVEETLPLDYYTYQFWIARS